MVSGAPAPLTAQGLGNANTPSTDPLLKPSPPTSTGGHGSGRTVGAAFAGDADQLDEGQRVEVPTAFADVADPLVPTPPRSLVEKAMRVVRWTAPRTGGHFAPLAAPRRRLHRRPRRVHGRAQGRDVQLVNTDLVE